MSHEFANTPRHARIGELQRGLPFQRVAVIGAGAWGTALAITAA